MSEQVVLVGSSPREALELAAEEIIEKVSQFICVKCELEAAPVIEGVGFDFLSGGVILVLDLLCPSGVCSHRGQMRFKIASDAPIQIFPQLHQFSRQFTCSGCGFMFGRPMFGGFTHFVLEGEDWVEVVRGCPMCVTKTRVRFRGEPLVADE